MTKQVLSWRPPHGRLSMEASPCKALHGGLPIEASAWKALQGALPMQGSAWRPPHGRLYMEVSAWKPLQSLHGSLPMDAAPWRPSHGSLEVSPCIYIFFNCTVFIYFSKPSSWRPLNGPVLMEDMHPSSMRKPPCGSLHGIPPWRKKSK